MSPRKAQPVAERFWAKVDKTPGCWNWTAATTFHGYGNFRAEGPRNVRAHRYSYEYTYGPIPEGLVIDHKCHNILCVNPSHLRAVTQKQNKENYSQQHAKNTSGVRGVSWHKNLNKWVASIHHHQHRIHVGVYTDLEEAAAAVLAKRNELFTCNDLDRQQQQAS